jgi:hypothetical protein
MVINQTKEDAMPNKRSRTDIHTGDRVRLEHSLEYGVVTDEDEGDVITVRLDKDQREVKTLRKWFVPVIEKEAGHHAEEV